MVTSKVIFTERNHYITMISFRNPVEEKFRIDLHFFAENGIQKGAPLVGQLPSQDPGQ